MRGKGEYPPRPLIQPHPISDAAHRNADYRTKSVSSFDPVLILRRPGARPTSMGLGADMIFPTHLSGCEKGASSGSRLLRTIHSPWNVRFSVAAKRRVGRGPLEPADRRPPPFAASYAVLGVEAVVRVSYAPYSYRSEISSPPATPERV